MSDCVNLSKCHLKVTCSACFGSTYTKIGTIQRRLAWSLRKNDMQIHEVFHIFFDKGGKDIQWKKDNFFNKWCWENWSTTCKRMKLEHFLTPYTKINSKWFKDLKCKTRNYKTPRGEHRQNTLRHKSQQDPL